MNYIENIIKEILKDFRNRMEKKNFNQTIKKVYRIPLSINSQRNTPTCQTFKLQKENFLGKKNRMTLHTDIIEKMIPVNSLKIL